MSSTVPENLKKVIKDKLKYPTFILLFYTHAKQISSIIPKTLKISSTVPENL